MNPILSSTPSVCQICSQRIDFDSQNSIKLRCCHIFHNNCWKGMENFDKNCPICHSAAWLNNPLKLSSATPSTDIGIRGKPKDKDHDLEFILSAIKRLEANEKPSQSRKDHDLEFILSAIKRLEANEKPSQSCKDGYLPPFHQYKKLNISDPFLMKSLLMCGPFGKTISMNISPLFYSHNDNLLLIPHIGKIAVFHILTAAAFLSKLAVEKKENQ